MPESINDILLRVMPRVLDGMRIQLRQANDVGEGPPLVCESDDMHRAIQAASAAA